MLGVWMAKFKVEKVQDQPSSRALGAFEAQIRTACVLFKDGEIGLAASVSMSRSEPTAAVQTASISQPDLGWREAAYQDAEDMFEGIARAKKEKVKTEAKAEARKRKGCEERSFKFDRHEQSSDTELDVGEGTGRKAVVRVYAVRKRKNGLIPNRDNVEVDTPLPKRRVSRVAIRAPRANVLPTSSLIL